MDNAWGVMRKQNLVYIGCNVPLMQNKKGDKICEGCGKNFKVEVKKNKIEAVKPILQSSEKTSQPSSLHFE